MHMNFLHCFYGIGVSLSPYIMAFALADNDNWRKGYLIAFFVQLAIAIVVVLSIPLWNKNKKTNEIEEEKPVTLGFMQMVKTPYILIVSLVFLFYCIVEVGFGQWSASFMVEARHITTETAAKLAGLFYVGLASGRFIAGLISNFVSNSDF